MPDGRELSPEEEAEMDRLTDRRFRTGADDVPLTRAERRRLIELQAASGHLSPRAAAQLLAAIDAGPWPAD